MPELPEVEAARRGIAEQLAGHRIAAVTLTLPKLVVAPDGLAAEQLVGRTLRAVRRHGKYLTLDLDGLAAVVHLKLSGQLVARGANIPGFAAGHPVPAYDAPLPHKSTHLVLRFDNDAELFLTDIRHFARLYLMPAGDLPAYFGRLRLGIDAIAPEFTREWLRERVRTRRLARLKPLLLDQTFLAGLGNIYVDESLHRARLHPERLASTLTNDEIDRLHDGIVEVLAIAVPIGGASILNGKASPEHGSFPFIHGRRGLPCLTCGTTIVKQRVNDRGTYLCPICQPAPAREPDVRDQDPPRAADHCETLG
jgi:formamidopyrimidine-DNA glycosylase